jgi:hypothetical protein
MAGDGVPSSESMSDARSRGVRSTGVVGSVPGDLDGSLRR